MVIPGGATGGSGTAGGPGTGAGPGTGTGAGPGTGGSGTGGTGGTGGGTTLPLGMGGGSGTASTFWRIVPTTIVVTTMVVTMMAFLMFGKRRRDQEPTAPDAVLGAAAACGSGLIASTRLVPALAVARATPVAPVAPVAPAAAWADTPIAAMASAAMAASAVQNAVAVAPPPVEMDAHLPRWRRPSLVEARKGDPLRSTDPIHSVSSSAHLTFAGAVGAAVTGLERRRIRYRLVSLLSAPDEVRGVEIGVLDEGDEVVMMEKRGTFWRVLCPDGREGWLHKMVLGDIVGDTSAANAGFRVQVDDGPPTGSFEDILRTYTEKRSQFGEA